MFKTSNPALSETVFTNSLKERVGGEAMTINGTVNKTAILLILVLIPAAWVWSSFFGADGKIAPQGQGIALIASVAGGIIGFIFALITIFKKTWAPVTAPIYALAEGLVLGGISATFELKYPGIVVQAIGLTFGTLFALLMAYRSNLIKATENFKLGLFAATGGIAIIYLVTFVLSFFGIRIPFIHESGLIGIGFSLFVVVVAALNLVLDFDFIEQGSYAGAPKYMEWYGAFGLIVTLIWLYLEFLRLLSKLRDRR